jgi:hypothetical protein
VQFCGTAAHSGEPSLQAIGVPGPDFLHGPQGILFCGTAACSEEPSLQTAVVLEPNFLHRLLEVQSYGAAAGSGEQSLQASGVPELVSHTGFRELSSVMMLLGEQSLLACTFCCPWSNGSLGTCLHRGIGFPVISSTFLESSRS